MTRIMHVNGKFTDIYSYVKKLFILAMLMGLGATETWAQPVEITTDANGNGTIEDAEKKLYLIQTNYGQSFYIAPQDNNTITTNNILGDYLLWYFLDAGTVGDTQYYYIVNNSTGKYIYNHNGNSRGISIISSSEFASLSDANKEKCKFKIVLDESNGTTGFYNIDVKANQTYYGLNKQGSSLANTNPIRLTNDDYIHDINSKWKFIPYNGTFTWPTPPFTISTDLDIHYYKIRNAQNNTYYVSTDATPDKVTYSNTESNSMVWYFKEAPSDPSTPWFKYYYIVNPKAEGKYMYYSGTATNGSNQTNAVSVKAYDSNNEDRFQFIVIQAARGDGTSRVICYAIIPKLLRENYWTSNSIGSTSIGNGTKMGIISSRSANNNAQWQFVTTNYPLKCTTPTITYSSETGKISITSTTPGTTIYYTTDGENEPSSSTGTRYSEPFNVSSPITIKAIATKDGFDDSEVTTKSFSQVATPTIQDNGSNAISITCETAGSTIYYTTNGNNPTTSSTEYTGPLTENVSSVTIKAIAVKDGMINSAVTSGSVTLKCAKPVFTVTTSGNIRTLTIKCAFPQGATIHYTKNEGASTQYSSAITVDIDDVITAYATASGFENSDVATKTIRQELTPTGDKYFINDQTQFETFIDMASSDESATYHYVLNADVNAGSEITIPFSGTFDGQGHTISGLGHALFNSINGGTVKNVILDGVNITSGTNVGAIANEATGASRIYNIGILDGSVGGSDNVGGIVGLLDDSSRVINCYSYATITGGTDVGGIVGYNNGTTTAGNINTMVMNCMFYGDITGGTTVSPVYGGNIINNLPDASDRALDGLNTFNYYAYEKLKTTTISDGKYNCAQAVEDVYLNRFEFYRQLLNSNRRLAAYYITGNVTDASIMKKWVLETADRRITNRTPMPYPILKEQGIYPSIINYDTKNLANYTKANRNKGLKTGTLIVTISGVGSNAPTGASITNDSLTLTRTDKDFEHFNYNYDKVQLPYYNEVGTKNYTDNKVVTGWKITGITGGTAGDYKAKDEWGGYNFADRNCKKKDLYDVSGRVFSQGAYFDVPYGVTAISIEPYWGNAAYVADEYMDVVHNTSYTAQDVTQLAKQFGDNGVEIFINGNSQKVYTSISNALEDTHLTGSTVYDNAIVLVGNVHLAGNPPSGSTPFTVMSIDLDEDNEPDYSFIFGHNDRQVINPVRFDFINMPGIAQAQKPNGATLFRNVSIFKPKGWFETTNTCITRLVQFEYDNGNKSAAPVILQGGIIDQFVSTKTSEPKVTTYIHIGGNTWFKDFGNGTHSDGNKFTPHIPISVTGGDFDGFYLSGTYRPDAAVKADNAECYISGGRFGEVAGAAQQQINGDVRWQIYNADIENFYGGGVNADKPVTGEITIDIFNSHVTTYCGGPKFGNMSSGKEVNTNATGCTFGTYFGAGYGGISYNRVRTRDTNTPDFSSWQNDYNNNRGKYISANGGIATDFDYEFFVWSTGHTGGRFYVKYSSLSTAQTNDVNSTLTNCIIKKDFYGGGSLGNVIGKATSILDGCEVDGNVFGGGYSASKPKVSVREAGFTNIPKIDIDAGVFDMGEMSDAKEYTLIQGTLTNNTKAINDDTKTIVTDVDLNTLGQVTDADLTIKGNTIVRGKIFNEDGTVKEETGGVFGGGDMSAVKGYTKVDIQNTEKTEGILNVFGGGNTADVLGDATITMTAGVIAQDVYGGGKGATTVVGGNVTVNLGTKTGTAPSFTYTGTGLVKHNLYGGSALGNVNTTPNASSVYDKTTTVNIYSGTVNGSVFGGGLGHDDADNAKDIIANNYGNTTVTVENNNNDNAKVLTAVYGGANENGVVKGGTTVTITGGTVGTLPTGSNPITNVVFGGGFGQPTLVEGNVMLNIGTQGQAGGGATINGHVYGGGALGSVNTSKPESVLVFDTEKKDSINLYKGTITGNVYGGGLGQKNGENGATSDIESFVGGDVTVTLDGAKLVTTFTGEKTESNDDRTFLSGQIFGANNLNGTPKGHVKVHVKRTVDSTKDDTKSRDQRTIYDVAAVYGGGNKADYIPTNATLVLDQAAPGYKVDSAKVANACAEVIIEGCEQNSIEYVYGGGNAAAVPATNVTVKGTYIINILYGGGNGKSTTGAPNNPGANVGTYDNGATEYGSGKAITKLIGGYINSVYGGSNTLGDVRGGTDVRTKEKSDPTPDGIICCEELNVGKIYGAGSHADVNNDVNIILECMPEDYVDAVYGGAEEATVNGNVTLVVTSGKFGRVFGGNNKGGDIRGTITVVAKEEGCQPLEIGELYGGGNQAPYSKYGCEKDGNNWIPNTSETVGVVDHTQGATYAIDVLVESCTSIGKIFGGGNEAEVIGNTHVEINMFHGTIESAPTTLRPIGRIGQVFGGGNLAKVTGNTTIHIGTDPEAIDPETGKVPNDQKKGVNIESGTYINPLTNSTITIPEAGIYGGGNQANVEGNATLTIGTANQSEGIKIGGNIFGGGYGETTLVTGNITVNIGKRTGSEEDGYSYEGYAQITGDIYGGSAKGKVNVTKGGTQESPTYSATPEKSTQVNFYGGTLSGTDKGNLYGGGKGEDNAGTVNDHAADVFGPVTVTMGSGTVNNVFGCNNVLGSPKDTVAVFINGGTVNHSVYGGGNQAVYIAPNGKKDYPAVSINNGTVSNNVFGGGLGTSAAVTGNPQVTIGDMDNSHTATVDGSVYGGGDAGDVRGNPHVKVQNTNTTIAKNVFGAGKGVSDTFTCEKAMVGVEDEGACEDPSLEANKNKGTKVTINNGTIGTLDGSENLVAGTGNVYGGGEIGRVEWNTQVEIGVGAGTCAPIIEGCVFGAGKGLETHGYAALVRGNSTVTIGGYAKIGKNVYGGGEIATVGRYWVKGIHPTTICTDEAEPTGAEVPDVPDGEPYKMRRGGICSVNIQGNVDIGYHGVASDAGHVFGAGRGVNPEITEYQYHASGDNRSKRMVTYDSEKHTGVEGVTWNYTDDTHAYVWEYFTDENAYKQFLETLALVSRSTVAINGCNIKGNVYGGSESGFVQTWTSVTIQGESKIGTSGSTTYGNVFGGGKGLSTFAEAGKVRGYTAVNISDGIVYGNVYGGGERGYVQQDVTVKVSGGQIINDVYGGGALANTNTENWDFTTPTSIYLEMSNLTFPSYSEKTPIAVGDDVTGLYTRSGTSEPYTYTLITDPDAKAVGETTYYERHPGSSVAGLYTKSGNVYSAAAGEAVSGTTYYEKRDLPGTWAAGKSSTSNTTKVILIGGIVGNVYGGGLGNPTHPVYVCGDVLVSVNDPDSIGENTGVAFTSRTKNDVTITGDENYHIVPLTGRVFGCNNINGTPLGDVNVKVFSTRTIGDNGNVIPHEDASSHTSYEIQAVYGGGNQANYVPASGKGTHVLIDGCNETTIKKVYGGGSSASVPATDVLIKAALDIGFAFGGGNGGEKVYDYVHSIWKNNDGASVNGLAKITCQGGKIGQVFGGSDNKGNCRSTSVTKSESGSCPLVITRMYGAGNEADVTGDVNIVVSGCTAGTSKIEYICGGSYNAHITGNVTLTITSGFFNSVYGGNEATGSIGGNITVNIEETDDCKPIIIGNLVGGGNMAPYPGSLSNGDPITKSGNITVNVKSATRIDNIFGGGYESEVLGNTVVNINMIKGYWAGKIYPTTVSDGHGGQITNTNENDRIPNTLGIIGNVYGGGNAGRVRGNTTVNIGTATNVQIMKRNASGKLVDSSDQEIYDALGNFNAGKSIASIVMVDKSVLGAHITGSVFGGGNEANVTGNTTVNIGTADYSSTVGFEGISIDKDANGKGGTVYGGGNQGDVLGNTNVTMRGGQRTDNHDVYVFNGIFGGGYSGSVGTYTRSTAAADVNVYGHTAHDGCIGKPTACTSGGTCTVEVTGGQIGPVDVAKDGMNRAEGGPVIEGWVWGGGCGVIEDPVNNPDTHFKTYVNNTNVTIGGTAFIQESIIGGGEFGRVLHDTHVTIQENCQVGVGNSKWETVGGVQKPIRYTEEQWTAAANAVASEDATAINTAADGMPECSHYVYGYNNEYLPYDPYYEDSKYATTHIGPASTSHPSDGQTWIGCVFGGGSGYMPYEKDDGTGYDWCHSAGLVEGNTLVEITGGHILNNVYGGNEVTDVKGTCTVTMSGGTIGVPRTLAQITAHPLGCYLFGAGKGDQRAYFNDFNNAGDVIINVSGGNIYGSVLGGAEDGHVLGNTSVTISGGTIGTWGTSYVEGNVFGGGRGFSGTTLGAGNVKGNATVNITGGIILGSVYGGGRMASVGTNFSNAQDPSTGQFIEDETTGVDPKTYGHVTINISGGTVGNNKENSVIAADGHTKGGNVFGGSMGRLTLLNGDPNVLWTKLAQVKTSSINIKGTALIMSNVYGGAEFGTTRDRAYVTVGGSRNESTGVITADGTPTINGHVYGGGYGSTINAAAYNSDIVAGETITYRFTPMQYAGIVGGETVVNIVGSSKVKGNVFGGGEMASVGVIDYSVNGSGNYINAIKHDTYDNEKNTFHDFGLSWPYKFEYVSTLKDGVNYIKGGKTTVNIAGSAEVGTYNESINAYDFGGYVFGGGKGKVDFNNGGVNDITEQRYTEAHICNVRETEVTIGGSSIVRTVYGGGDDGHVLENANVTIDGATIRRSVYGGGKGTDTYKTYLLNTASAGNLKLDPEYVCSWTAGKVYGNTSVTMNGGSVGWFIYGGGNMASVGKGNYTGGSDDYSTGGYGELPSTSDGAIWTSTPTTGTYAHYFQNSGIATVNIYGGEIGKVDDVVSGFDPTDGIPYGSVFGGSRGKAAKSTTYSPRYKYVPDFFMGYVNKARIKIGKTEAEYEGDYASYSGPTFYGSIYGGGQDGHVRNSTEVTINKGALPGKDGDIQGRAGHIFGAGSGIGRYTDGDSYCNSSSGSVTCTTQIDVKGGTISGNIYGGGALASVGPRKTEDFNEFNNTTDPYPRLTNKTHGSQSYNKVTIEGGSITGSVYGASRGPGSAMFSGVTPIFTGIGTGDRPYDPTKFATSIWTEVNVKGGTIDGNVYGGGEMGQVKESTVVNLTGGSIAHDAYGGGKGTRGTNAIEANVGGNTTVKLNEGKTASSNGCIVEKIFGCNDINGTPKGHALVHVYATQHRGTTKIVPDGGKYTKFKSMEGGYTIDESGEGSYKAKTNADDLGKLAQTVGFTSDQITAYETAIHNAAPNDSIQKVRLNDYIEAISDRKYDVLAVYGGGDLAMYEPSDPNEATDVIIDGCALTSIKQVYGGGNAASTPATNIRINAAYEIHEAFGGGNGKDVYEIDDEWYENPGANVGYYATFHHTSAGGTTPEDPHPAVENDGSGGYKDATTKDARRANYPYGKGTTRLEITGGHIHTTYGGSNTRGNVRAEAFTGTEDAGDCPMQIDKSYSAGKSADTDAGSKVEAKCVELKQDAIYGGSLDANVYSDVVIDITNGTFGKVYGGNDTRGKIYGSITINVHEEGCKPIVIDSLYIGGKLADYSIYGFNDNGTARTKAQYDALVDKTGITVQRDPQINIISATKIGTIYGGGYQAKVIGNPSINVNMEKGKVLAKYANDPTKAAAYTVETHDSPDGYTYEVVSHPENEDAILAIGTIGSIYGGGFKGDVQGNTSVAIGTGEWLNQKGQRETTDADGKVYTYNSTTEKWDWTKTVGETTETGTVDNKPVPARNAATITGNVFGGGEGEALESGDRAFYCESAMVGVDREGEDPTKRDGGTTVIIANGTVGTIEGGNLKAGTGNVYGGGEIGRVEKNTVVTIGVEGATGEGTKFRPTVWGSVFGAGKGVATHGYSALVRGNSTVTIQGVAKVGQSVYGGGEKSSIGRYTVAQTDEDAAAHGVERGMPYSLLSDNSGSCTVIVRDSAEIGPNDMIMTRSGGPDNSGHVFGGGQGVNPYEGFSSENKPWRMTMDGTKEVYNTATAADTLLYLKYVESLGLATQTDVTIGGNSFVKGDVFGGAEQGFVQHDTKVTIQDNCQIGGGYVQMNDAGEYLASPYSLNRRYTDAEWAAGILDEDGESNYQHSLPECASWKYQSPYAPHDIFAKHEYDGKTYYDSEHRNNAYGGALTATNGSTFYGTVFGGGSGYFPYAAGKWHWKAGNVGGNTVVEIKGGHILTNVYGGNELSNVEGSCTVTMSGGTIGVPRTLGQIIAHPVTGYLFGAGKGDPRVLFNKQTNVKNVKVNVTGGTIYGSVLGGGEDGHVFGNDTVNISGGTIGTWGTSYVDGNVFGGGRGFAGDAYTAGNVAGSVTMNISGGTMLGSVYGGGRLGSVGYGLYAANDTGYGKMRDDNKFDDGTTEGTSTYFPNGRGHIEINISGGTIGNDYEYIMPNATNIDSVNTALSTSLNTDFTKWNATDWTTWQNFYNVPSTTYDTSDGRLHHTRGGNVYAGGMGRRLNQEGEVISMDREGINWLKLGNVKSTKLTITGGTIKSNVYGGGEYGAVMGNHMVDGEALSTEISITGGTIGTEILGASASDVKYTYGSVFGGGTGTTDDVAMTYPVAKADTLGAYVADSTRITLTNAIVKASVFGGGELSAVGGSTHVTISGTTEIGRNEVYGIDEIYKLPDTKNPGYVKYGSWRMGNVYGGGRGSEKAAIAGLVKGNTNILISGGNVYHNVYGGGAIGSVGTFFVSSGTGEEANIPTGVPYWKIGQYGAEGPNGLVDGKTGLATVTITGGTIGISGRDNGLVFGSSRGDISKPTGSPKPIDQYDRVAWVRGTVVNIGAPGSSGRTTPLIKGSVYGGGENGHNYQNAIVNINSGTIGIADKIPGTDTVDPWWTVGNDSLDKEYRAYRGNVYGAGSGSDTYKGDDGKQYHNPKAGFIGGSTIVNIKGGHIGRSVYGAGAMASLGNITNVRDTTDVASGGTGIAKHKDITTVGGKEVIHGLGLSWPYKFEFATMTGKTTINVTGGHIGTKDVDGGDIFGGARGKAGDRYEMAHLSYVNETEVNINYPSTPAASVIPNINDDFSIPCITGSVSGSGEDGYVYGDTHVTLNEGLVGHSLYGGGKGKGTYKVTLKEIVGNDTYEADIYSLIAGKVFGNTFVTMNGGYVGRNVYGGGNMASVGKGNYASGVDDYFPNGYGETLVSGSTYGTGNLWDGVSEESQAFLSSGKTTVKVFGGTVGYVAANPENSIKNNLPYGNVFGGSTGEAAPNVPQSLSPRYHYCPAFFSGYVNETDVNIGGYECKEAFTYNENNYTVGERMTLGELQTALDGSSYFVNGRPNPTYWEAVGPTRIYGSVYGGGQDGHVRRDTHVTVVAGEIGLAYNSDNQSLLKTDNLDDYQWLHRGNVYGAGSGISEYEFDFNNDGDKVDEGVSIPGSSGSYNEKGYSTSAGSVTRFTQVDIYGGTIHRNVYGGGSMASIGPLKTDQEYDPYKKDINNTTTLGKQSMNIVNIRGTIGTPEDYQVFYGGEVYGASRGLSSLNANQFSTSIWTQVNILKGAKIMGSVFGGGDNGMVKKDADVIVGGE